MNAAGDRQYLGSSSGVLMACFIKACVDIKAISRPPSPRQEVVHGKETMASAAEMTADLPSEAISLRLVTTYLSHDHLCYPVILPVAALNLVQQIYASDKMFYALNPQQAFIFDMILAIATASSSSSDWHLFPAASSHYARAMVNISKVLEMGGLGSLQALILLTQYRMSSSVQDNSASKIVHLICVCFLKRA